MSHGITTKGSGIVLSTIEDSVADDSYYVFLSKVTAWGDPDEAPSAPDDSDRAEQDARDELVVAKRVYPSDVKRMVARSDWTSNTVYDQYENDSTMEGADFFVVNASREVYKCLDNADGSPSLTEPELPLPYSFTTADGYVWRYVYAVSEESMSSHASADSVPVDDTDTTTVSGTVDVVRILESGSAWPNTETCTVSSFISNNAFLVQGLENSTDSHYVDFGVYAQDGPGAGFVTVVTSYVANSLGQYVTTAHGNSLIEFGTTLALSPSVRFSGDGSGATAYSTVNATTGKIESVRVVDPGSGYTRVSVEASCNSIFESTATLEGVPSPRGGHGSDAAAELRSRELKMAVEVTPVDAPLVKFRVVGLLRNPSDPDGDRCTASRIRGYYSAPVTLSAPVTYAPSDGETLTGSSSGAQGLVLRANTTYLHFFTSLGEFEEGELVTSGTTSSAFTLGAIDTPTVNADTGDVMFLEYLDPVQRQNTSSERVSVTFRA